jgi:predicted transcriptional regulator
MYYNRGMPFKDRLAAVLRRSGLTQVELAARLGVNQSVISRYLLGAEPRATAYERMKAELETIDAELDANGVAHASEAAS